MVSNNWRTYYVRGVKLRSMKYNKNFRMNLNFSSPWLTQSACLKSTGAKGGGHNVEFSRSSTTSTNYLLGWKCSHTECNTNFKYFCSFFPIQMRFGIKDESYYYFSLFSKRKKIKKKKIQKRYVSPFISFETYRPLKMNE